MAMSDLQKKLRRWFRNHGYHTCNTPTNQGFYLESPTMNCAGFLNIDEFGKHFCWEYYVGMELDRFCCDYITITFHRRKHYWKETPTEEFSEWEGVGYYNIPAVDIGKLAELTKEAQVDWLKDRPSKNHLNFMERISKSCDTYWIGRNSSYEEIKQVYRKERE